jgi:hypothetical protein
MNSAMNRTIAVLSQTKDADVQLEALAALRLALPYVARVQRRLAILTELGTQFTDSGKVVYHPEYGILIGAVTNTFSEVLR